MRLILKKHERECVLYTTVEPCIMCLSTIVMANIRHVVFAVKDQYMNMDPFIASNPYIKDRLYHYVGGVLKEVSEKLIQTYSPYMYQIVLQGKKPGDAP
ncbi:deaminase [Geobacillus sp. TFV-3]|uniref:deaminase n=1 Tax=Geobacillus sp. TFV-3 TaxID=1897059 RepID=UPI0022A6D2E0|nr:deaminase [Geobacillus sp. TFV-3]